MVLESLIKAQKAEKRPILVFLISMLYSSAAVLLTWWIFNKESSILLISFITFASIPLMHKIILLEEKKDKNLSGELSLLMEHRKALISFTALFFGILISLSLWYIFLPSNYVEQIFSVQIKEVKTVENQFSGNVINPNYFFSVFLNNLRVLFFSFIFSFFFGAGAIFIFAWNASIISTALGSFVRESISSFSGKAGFGAISAYFGGFSYGFFGYMIHGIFEMSSYFVAGLAGGIISVAVIKHDLFNKNFKKIIVDSFSLIIISFVLLLFGAFVETFVTPLIF